MRAGLAGPILLAGLIGAAPAMPAPGPAPGALTALDQVEPGLWQLETAGKPPRLRCLVDPVDLVQIEHEQPACSRFVIANEPRSSTVHYSCPRSGWGRTTVRVETPRLVSIRTQGIARNAPFEYSVVARRVGPCGQPAGRPR
jgi:hypothetical protein